MGTGMFSVFTLDNPLSLPLILGLNGLSILLIRSIRWIEVAYQGAAGKFETAYFAAAGRALFGGSPDRSNTLKLFDSIRAAIFAPPERDSAAP
jgi:hypothetical protein